MSGMYTYNATGTTMKIEQINETHYRVRDMGKRRFHDLDMRDIAEWIADGTITLIRPITSVFTNTHRS